MVEGLTTAGSDKGFDAKIYGNIPGAKIAGYNIVKHTYLGQMYQPMLLVILQH